MKLKREEIGKMAAQPLFEVNQTGLLTSFQDIGRVGYQQYGVPVSGAMDTFSLQMANLLVGNARAEAGIEITMVGPNLTARTPLVAGVCGADLGPRVNGEEAPIWKSFRLNAGDRLTFSTPKQGLRAYLAVSGGFDIPVVMGSKSTYEKAGLGTPIQKGDTLLGPGDDPKPGVGLRLQQVPQYEKDVELRVVEGPHTKRFQQESVEQFFHESYTVTPQADRMGYRLSGTALNHKDGADIWTDAIPFGGIQVPADGQPILLMADRQTTGGYTRIGTVISVDLPKAAQLAPGGSIRFSRISVEDAHALYHRQELFFQKFYKQPKH